MSNVMVVMTAALAAELLLLLVGLLLFSWIRNRAARRRDNQAMRVLVTRIKQATAERELVLGRFLSERMGLAGESLEQARTAIARAELSLLKRFAVIYKKRDAGAAAQFDIDVVAALAPYHQLQGAGAGTAATQAPEDPSELEALRAENARLSEELGVTMETMARMLNEYSTLFAGGVASDAVSMHELTGSDAPQPESGPVDGVEVDVAGATVEVPDRNDREDTADEAAGAADSDAEIAIVAEDQDSGEGVAGDDIDALFSADSLDVVNETGPSDAPASADDNPDTDEPVLESPLETGDVEPTDDAPTAPDPAVADEPRSEEPGTREPADLGGVEDVPAADASAGQVAAEPVTVPSLDRPEPSAGLPSEAPAEVLPAADTEEETDETLLVGLPDPDQDAERERNMPAAVLPTVTTSDEPAAVMAAEVTAAGEDLPGDAGPTSPAVDRQARDDADAVSDLFEVESTEVVAFDEPDADLFAADEDLFDPVDSEAVSGASADPGEGNTDVHNADDLFDAVDQPLKRQSGS
jgi:hypothetical protein